MSTINDLEDLPQIKPIGKLEDYPLARGEPGNCPFPNCVKSCEDCPMHDACESGRCPESPEDHQTKEILPSTPLSPSISPGQLFPCGPQDFLHLNQLSTGVDPTMQVKELPKGVTVAKKKIFGTNIYLGKASGLVDGSPIVVMRLLWDFDVRRKWDSYFVEQRVLQRCGGLREYVYFDTKTPPLVTKRDFVQFRDLEISPDRTVYSAVYKSVEHPSTPPRPNRIRGHVFFSGFHVVRVNPTQCRVSMVTHTDFKGMIPTWVINMMIGPIASSWIENLRQAVAKFGPPLEAIPWP